MNKVSVDGRDWTGGVEIGQIKQVNRCRNFGLVLLAQPYGKVGFCDKARMMCDTYLNEMGHAVLLVVG